MLNFLPAPLRGMIAIMLYTLNLALCTTLVLPVLIGKIVPIRAWRQFLTRVFFYLPGIWIELNRKVFRLTTRTQILCHAPPDLRLDHFYLVMANHQSWADILVLFMTLDGKIPMVKFFPKKQLFWVPLIGQLCWIYGYPFLHRHTKSQLAKHPEWKGRDLEVTKKACERFASRPGSLLIFPEGTRFTEEKRARQQSPYVHLLKPKAGGLAFSLQCMNDVLKNILDITIVYPEKKPTLWDFCCGRMDKIIVDIEALPITPEIQGDYENDADFRKRFQQFINQRWAMKDQKL